MNIDLPCSGAPRVSVIIVANSNFDLLRACLRSVARFAPSAIPFETIVVLNEADVGTEAELRAMVRGVQVASSPVNLGFAGAGNRGRSLGRGEFLLLLHDDAEVESGWMEALVQTADLYPEARCGWGKGAPPGWPPAKRRHDLVATTPTPLRLGSAKRLLQRLSIECARWTIVARVRSWSAPRHGTRWANSKRSCIPCTTSTLTSAWRYGSSASSSTINRPRASVITKVRAATRVFARSLINATARCSVEKWGTALDAHEPPHEAITRRVLERAIARAEAFAAQCRPKGPGGDCPAGDAGSIRSRSAGTTSAARGVESFRKLMWPISRTLSQKSNTICPNSAPLSVDATASPLGLGLSANERRPRRGRCRPD